MGMYNFNPDDPSAGVFGTASAQHVAQLWKNNIGDTPQPYPYDLKKTKNSTATLSKINYGLSEKKNQAVLDRISAWFNRDLNVSLSSKQKTMFNEGIEKLKDVISHNDIKKLESLTKNPDINSETRNTALSLIYLSSFNKKNPMKDAADYIHYLIETLDNLDKYQCSDKKHIDLCHMLANTVFDEIALKFGISKAEKMDAKIYNKYIKASINKSIEKMDRKPSIEQADNYEKLIKEKYQDKMSSIVSDASFNKLKKFYYRVNFTILLSENIQSMIFPQYKNGVEKCQVL